MGGLSRRKSMLDSLRAEFGQSVLLDNGNLLSLTPDPVGDGYMIEGLARLGYNVEKLKRTAIGPLTDRGLKIGSGRVLSDAEVSKLKKSGLKPL